MRGVKVAVCVFLVCVTHVYTVCIRVHVEIMGQLVNHAAVIVLVFTSTVRQAQASHGLVMVYP